MKVKKAVITAAGLGTRFLPATKIVPKPMLPVFDKPTIQYIMEEIEDAGIHDVAIIISPNSTDIKRHFSEYPLLENNLKETGKKELYDVAMKTRSFGNITYVVQEKPTGLADAVLCAESFSDGEPFALLMGDEIYDYSSVQTSCLKKLINEYEETGASQVNTINVFGDDVSKYGNLDAEYDGGRLKVKNIIEKPSLSEAFSNLGSVGRYVLSPKVFGYIKSTRPAEGGEVYLTGALKALADNDGLYACEFDEKRYDIGDKAGYIEANVDFALKNKKIKEELKDYLKSLSEKL